MVHGEQLRLFEIAEPLELDSRLWAGSFNAKESSMHQLAPYVGKLKSGMVRVLIDSYSEPGDVVLDPFCGSGVVPLECVLKGRHAIANDLSPYAYVITRGKLSAPSTKREALLRAEECLQEIERRATSVDPGRAPEWVRMFFHPDTFKEVLAAFDVLRERSDYFLMACLLGILHHVRPGFLSYPASHLTPYLRPKMYPPDKFPGMYSYRDLRSRLLAKVERAYRRPMFSSLRDQVAWKVLQENSMSLSLADGSVDATDVSLLSGSVLIARTRGKTCSRAFRNSSRVKVLLAASSATVLGWLAFPSLRICITSYGLGGLNPIACCGGGG